MNNKEPVYSLQKKFFLIYMILLPLLILSTYGVTLSYQKTLAADLAKSQRNNLLIRDYRSAMSSLQSATSLFPKILYFEKERSQKVIQVDGPNNRTLEYFGIISITIFSDSNGTVAIGNLNFYYPLSFPLIYGFFVWLLFLIPLIPLFEWQKRKMITFVHKEIELAKLATIVDIAQQVSHDIRSPLSTLHLLRNRFQFSDRQTEDVAFSAIERIQQIIADLHINVMDKRSSQVLKQPTKDRVRLYDISKLIRTLVEAKRTEIQDSFITLEVDIPTFEDCQIVAESAILIRIVSNLLNNSIEALSTRRGEIRCSLRRDREAVSITVSDDGPGIPEEIQDKLGTKGFSFDKEDGSGLGIYHAKKHIQAWGGKLIIQSKVGVGTMVLTVLLVSEEN